MRSVRVSWWLILAIGLLFGNVSEAKHGRHHHPSAVVVGTVYCDTCFQQDFTRTSHFISGASVAVKCGNENLKTSFYKEVKTNKHGVFEVHLPDDVSAKRVEECRVKLISSSEPFCAVASSATSSSLRLKARKDRTHVFSAGVFTFKPLKQPELCNRKETVPSASKFTTSLDAAASPPTIPNPTIPTIPTVPTVPTVPTIPTIPTFPTIPIIPLPPLPTLPPLPGLPGLPQMPPFPTFPQQPKQPTQPEATNGGGPVSDKKTYHPTLLFPPIVPPILPTPPPTFGGLPLPPNPLQPAPLLPNPLQPPAPAFGIPPILPTPILPPIPVIMPSPPPPPPSLLPPLPQLPPLPFPGVPPASASKKTSP